jgi:aminoglycoside phosphotransferase (APT) family kinase protein
MSETLDSEAVSRRLITYLRSELDRPALDLASPLTPLKGGYETSIYHFKLHGASRDLSGPLVLRLYPEFYGTGNAVWESTVQNILADVGYPVARAHTVCTDMSVLGGAFFIMDYLPGRPLVTAQPERVPGLLGKAHAELHAIDPALVTGRLEALGIAEWQYGLTIRFDRLRGIADKLPWLRPSVNWLLDHRPPEPQRPALCHGDFHALNILYTDGEVTGVLDWGGFAVADPAFDIGNSVVLITIAYKHLAASLTGLTDVDWDHVADLYVAAYRAHRDLNDANLDYYRVRRCVLALINGAEGQKVWQHPGIVEDLLAYIYGMTGIQIDMPSPS